MDQLTQVKKAATATWNAGDFSPFGRALVDAGMRMLDRLGMEPGERVLDVGCGTGNLAIAAARAGAAVTAVDLADEMIDASRAAGARAGVQVDWVLGDAEDLPVEDASADIAVSSFGCMFAPRHAVAARELARAVRPGGRIGLLTWPPDSMIGALLKRVAPLLPPPPSVMEPPLAWGDEDHVADAFAGTGVDVDFARDTIDFPFGDGHETAEVFLACYGPFVTARGRLEPEGRWGPVERAVRDHFTEVAARDGASGARSSCLVVLGRRGT